MFRWVECLAGWGGVERVQRQDVPAFGDTHVGMGVQMVATMFRALEAEATLDSGWQQGLDDRTVGVHCARRPCDGG